MKSQTRRPVQNAKSKTTKTFSTLNILGKERKRLSLKDRECINRPRSIYQYSNMAPRLSEKYLNWCMQKNAVGHMLSSKAIARAIRGHFLVDAALNTLLVCDAFNIPLPVNSSVDDEIQTAMSLQAQRSYKRTQLKSQRSDKRTQLKAQRGSKRTQLNHSLLMRI